MKSTSKGMVLITTLGVLSIMACMWLSLIHVLFLFRKVTHELQLKREHLNLLEQDVASFLKAGSSHTFEACMLHPCKTPSGVVFYVKKIACLPCLSLDKDDGSSGTFHWDIHGKYEGKELVIRWATSASCGTCQRPVTLLNSPMLSWSLYP